MMQELSNREKLLYGAIRELGGGVLSEEVLRGKPDSGMLPCGPRAAISSTRACWSSRGRTAKAFSP